MKKILITGAKGFIGKNLIAELKNRQSGEIFEFDSENTIDELENFTRTCDIVFHLAGINRPKNVEEFSKGNFDFTNTLLSSLRKHNNSSPIIFSSSVQAKLDNPYGKSKLAAENTLITYSLETGIPVSIYRLFNVFGKWCRPSYNSVVATFCHNIARNLPIQINDPESRMQQVYIMDVVDSFIRKAEQISRRNDHEIIESFEPAYEIKVGELASTLYSFKETRNNLSIPDQGDPLTRKLYATYLSYLPENEFSYPLKMNIDNRGSFTEFIRTTDRGQVSVNITKPGIVKGNHWHHTKNEKFLVVSGNGIIRFRKPGNTEIIEYNVNGETLVVVDIPTGYTHNIENVGTTDLITIMWANEAFDHENPDTYFEKV
ncbi:MAG TPA: NAD-dependent epimerase/dehydratase family protein [Bacteroidales bacterium]|nr:NAD-dependent epimerase/dehydratase family protein [Bacteroidales bacterium]